MPAHVPSTGVPEPGEVAQRVAQPLTLDPEGHDRRLPAGNDQRVKAVEVGRDAHLARHRAQPAQDLGVRLEVALEREDSDQRRALRRRVGHGYQPRPASSCSDSSLEDSRLTIGCPRPAEAAATRAGSW